MDKVWVTVCMPFNVLDILQALEIPTKEPMTNLYRYSIAWLFMVQKGTPHTGLALRYCAIL